MAQHLSAERQARRAVRHLIQNRTYMSRMKTAIKRVRALKQKEKAIVELQRVCKLLDQLASKGIIHRNNAANKKSSLTRYVASLPA